MKSMPEFLSYVNARILDAMAHTLYVNAMADHRNDDADRVCNGPKAGPGEDWSEVVEGYSPEALQTAHTFAAALAKENDGASLVDLVIRAAEADGVGIDFLTSDEADVDAYLDDFGYHLAMEGKGHGVSWTDDHEDFGIKFPFHTIDFNIFECDHCVPEDEDTPPCDECGEVIPDSEDGAVNEYHKLSCSLHPSNVVALPDCEKCGHAIPPIPGGICQNAHCDWYGIDPSKLCQNPECKEARLTPGECECPAEGLCELQDAMCGYTLKGPNGKKVSVQVDYEFPALASHFGWAPCCGLTDGTVECPVHHTKVSDMISQAIDVLSQHDGYQFKDPGYFTDS